MKIFEDKKIIVVGPSPSLQGQNLGGFIDSFDLVIKINNGYKLNPKDYGSRCDVLFHCFGLGAVEDHFKPKETSHIPYIIFSKKYKSDLAKSRNKCQMFFEENPTENSDNVYDIIEDEFLIELNKQSKGLHFQTGTHTLLYLLKQTKAKQIHAIGFSFFQDGYAKEYKTWSFEYTKKHSKKCGHNFNKDLLFLCDQLEDYKDRFFPHGVMKSILKDKETKHNDTKVIILAGGDAKRWNNYKNTLKHFVCVNNEPIIKRTVRLLHEKHRVKDITIVACNQKQYDFFGAKFHQVERNNNNLDVDKFLSSKELWNKNGRTIVLFGDVFYTENALEQILQDQNTNWKVFGRFGPSKFSKKQFGELFAQSFWSKDIARHEEMLYYILSLQKQKIIKRAIGWEHYRAMNGAKDNEVSKHILYPESFVEIHDWTEDFDYPKDYEKFMQLYPY
jgi:choline kinase